MKNPVEVGWIAEALQEINVALSRHSLGIRFAYEQVIEVYTNSGESMRIEFEDGKVGVADW